MSPSLGRVPDRQSRARRAGYDPAVLSEASVIVVGAGALGQNVLLDLGLSGVGELRIVDGDVFEDHNLTRSPLFPRDAGLVEGLGKAVGVGGELARLHTAEHPRIRFADAWIEDLGLGAFDGVDLIAACVDSLQARDYLAQVAVLLGLPIVDGGFSGENVGMTAYPTGDDPTAIPCWRCGGDPVPGAFSCRQVAEFAGAAGVIPAIQNGAAALGALCAEAIVMLLHGRVPEPKRISLDIRTGESLVFRPSPSPHCAPQHRVLPRPVETTLGADASAADLLASHGSGADSLLFLPNVFVERAPCPGCGAACEVEAPAHRWQRTPGCHECGGPWPRLGGGEQGQDVIAELDPGHPRASEPLARLGVSPGDVLEIYGEENVAVKLAGGGAGLWREAIPLSAA